MCDLDKALKDLKNIRSRDPEGLINEIFKKDVIGDDLKESLLVMFNKLEQNQIVPKFMNLQPKVHVNLEYIGNIVCLYDTVYKKLEVHVNLKSMST